MAARLCRSLCYPCKAVSECCDECCTKCCVTCCNACDGCCRAVGQCMSGACAACDKCCSTHCASCMAFLARPMAICTTFTFLVGGGGGIAALVLGSQALASGGGNCGDLPVWLLVQGVLMALQVAMACYLLSRLSRPYDRSNRNDRDFVARMSHLACEDCGVALYILALILMVAWQIVGSVWLLQAPANCDSDTLLAAEMLLALMWLVLGLGAAMITVRYYHAWCVVRCCPEVMRGPWAPFLRGCCPCFVPSQADIDLYTKQPASPAPAPTGASRHPPAQPHTAVSVPPPHPLPEAAGMSKRTGAHGGHPTIAGPAYNATGAVPVARQTQGPGVNTGKSARPNAAASFPADALATSQAAPQPQRASHVYVTPAPAPAPARVSVPVGVVPVTSKSPAPAPAPAAAGSGGGSGAHEPSVADKATAAASAVAGAVSAWWKGGGKEPKGKPREPVKGHAPSSGVW